VGNPLNSRPGDQTMPPVNRPRDVPETSTSRPEPPKSLKPYLSHGLRLDWEGRTQAECTCPFCGREGKFYCAVETGLWDCKVCGQKGNNLVFLRELWKVASDATNGQTKVLAADRGLLYPETLTAWEVVVSPLTGDWLVPGYGADRKMTQLYRYAADPRSGRRRLLATAEMPHGLHGVHLYEPHKPVVYLCEGPWDAMALWEVLGHAKVTEDGYAFTGNRDVSLLADANVLAVPGANVFSEQWCRLLAGKVVYLLFDSDHPVGQNGSTAEPVGLAGMKRVANVLARSGDGQPKEVHYLHWGDGGYDPARKGGYDVRDLLADDPSKHRFAGLDSLIRRLRPIPQDWVSGTSARRAGSVEVECLPCGDWRTLQMAWRKAMNWSDGLDRALSVMLASVASVNTVGDQLWVKVIGPAACGKSSLCEGVSVNKRHVVAKSSIRGFHSGFKTDAAGKEDNSLMASLPGKTLVTKDGDTLLQSPNLPQILSEARDVYDGTSRTHYRNKMGKDYENFRVTWILCGTAALRSIDSSELGERFLDCVIMDRIDDEEEDDILDRVVNRTVRNMQSGVAAAGGKVATADEDMMRAMRLTGGYVDYLKANADDLLARLDVPEDATRLCKKLAKFVAYMRARPSSRQVETAEREFASRLSIQLTRLAMCLAVVLGRRGVDAEVMRRVRQVALDTARGRVLEIARHLHDSGEKGLQSSTVSLMTNHKPEDDRALLRFLRKIEAVELFTPKSRGVTQQARWRLTPTLRRLYAEVVGR
jgi:hypothetical protein